jgi:hypothetical protein
MMRQTWIIWTLLACLGCDDDDFENPCDPQNIAEGNCVDAAVMDATVDAKTLDMQRADQAMDAAARDMRVPDMTPVVDMAVDAAIDMPLVVDMAVDMPVADMAVGCVNPDYNAACATSEDAESCVANGGRWGQWVFAEPPVESCDCPTRDGGCPCMPGECSVTCYVPVNEGGDGCSDEPPRCWARTQALGCFCDAAGEGVACP